MWEEMEEEEDREEEEEEEIEEEDVKPWLRLEITLETDSGFLRSKYPIGGSPEIDERLLLPPTLDRSGSADRS